jgi:hypothetical protein
MGGALDEGQQVLIMAFTPEVERDETSRTRAMDEIDQMVASADAQAKALGITAEEADAAVEEAMQHIRGRGG